MAALFVSACGNSHHNTGPSTTIGFSGTNPGTNSVYMERNSSLSSGDTLAVDVKVKDVTGVYGAAFDVDFDSSKMTYSSYSQGSFLEDGGNTVNYQVGLQSGNSSKLVVGISRRYPAGGNSGSGTLVTLMFNVTSGGSIDFSNKNLKDSSNQTISANWYGGTVTVQ